MTNEELIINLENTIRDLIGRAESLKALELEVLRTKTDEDSWSILECFEHLNRYSEFYIREIRNKIQKAEKVGVVNYQPGWFGGKSADSMLPTESGEVKNKMKAFKSKNPSIDHKVDPASIETFISDQNLVLELIKDARQKNLNVRTATTLPLIHFKLGDTLNFYINHETRHLVQAERTLNELKMEQA